VEGKLPGALKSNDLRTVMALAEQSGYEPRPGSDDEFQLVPFNTTILTLRLTVEEARDDAKERIQEEIFLSGWTIYFLAFAIFTVFVWGYLPGVLGPIVAVLSLVIFGGFLSGFVIIHSPLAQYLDHVRMDDTKEDENGANSRLQTVDPATYQTSCIGPPLTALLAGFAATGPVFISGIPVLLSEVEQSPHVSFGMIDTWILFPAIGAVWMLGFWALGFVIGLFIYTFEDDATRIQVFPFDLVSRIRTPVPELSGGYFALLGLAIIPLFALTESSFILPATYRLSSRRLWAYFMLPATIIGATLPVFLYWWVVQNREYVYARTLGRLSELSSPRQRIGVALLTMGTSLFFVWILSRFMTKFWSYLGAPIANLNLLPPLEKPFLVGLLIVSALPAVYMLLGVFYQSLSHLIGLVLAIKNSKPIGESPREEYQVRLIDTPTPRAFAMAIGPWRSIVVSKGLRVRLKRDEDAFTALLVHEEAHLNRGDGWISDAQLSTLLPIIGLMTATGKNILYALADFRSRENAADDHAAEVVSIEALDRALETFDTGGDPSTAGAPFLPVPGIHTPGTLGRPESIQSAFERYFGLLYGNFALVRAHPDPMERRLRLRRNED
jgi:Zn-dependent protease with chaperone function